MNKIGTIENSLRCLTFGLLGLIPLFGVGFSIAAFICFSRSTRMAEGGWNPAQRHARLGHFFAVVGLVLNCAAWCGVFLWGYRTMGPNW